MRFFAIAADVAMGIILGMFIYAAFFTIWPRLHTIPVGLVTVAACVIIVLYRRPNGSLARRSEQ
jgi:hypothetical protein